MTKKRLCMTLSYDGSRYSGYQKQPNAMTIQGEMERALCKLTGETIHIDGSGRTDAGVHAHGQVAHFDTHSPIPVDAWTRALNGYLPEDITVLNTVEVSSNFHARRSAIAKTYRYSILNSRTADVFLRKYSLFCPRELDLGKMREAMTYFIGTHDFTSFCSERSTKASHVRTIHTVNMQKDLVNPELIHLYVNGNGFLFHMVRIMVGTLMFVGLHKLKPSDIQEILQAKDRSRAAPTAPPHGLTLWEVQYDFHEVNA